MGFKDSDGHDVNNQEERMNKLYFTGGFDDK